MRVALVGCGRISRVHIAALRGIEGLTLSAVCDRDPWRAQAIAGLADGAKAYDDLATMLREERLDALHILTPPDTHAPLAIQAMEAGCHVLVEKPMALAVHEADAMIAAARDNRVKLCTNHNYLFNPSLMEAKRLLESGAIGEVVHVYSYYGQSNDETYGGTTGGSSHWAFRLPGGVFTNFLPHLIALQQTFLQVESVAGVTVAQDGAGTGTTEMTVLLQGSSASGTMCISMRTKPYAKFVDVYGTKGILHADLAREVCTIHRARRLPRMLNRVMFSLEDSVQLAAGTALSVTKAALGKLKNYHGLHVLVRRFYESIRTDGEPPVPGEAGRKMVEVLENVWQRLPTQPARSGALSPTLPSPAPHPRPGPRSDAERLVVEGKGLPGRVLVTGATGFLGYRMVEALSRCGADVVALVRDKTQVSTQLERRAELVCGDIRDPGSLEAAMRDIAVVYHCAGITTNSVPWTSHFETNVQGTENVFKQALNARVQRVIHVSSVMVYGPSSSRTNGLVKESTPYAQKPHRWAHYLRSKVEADKLAFSYWREHGLPVTVIRPGILYGPGTLWPISRRLIRIGGLGLLIGRGENHLPYTYIDNAVDCLLLAAMNRQAIGQAYNVVDEPELTVRELVVESLQLQGDRSILVAVPPFLLFTAAALLELKSRITGAKTSPGLSRFAIRSACRDLRYDTARAREELGWRPAVSVEEGVRRAVASIA
jgi:nucleoside-diphosphate-sugar epimerase/predicted dehydrogenase